MTTEILPLLLLLVEPAELPDSLVGPGGLQPYTGGHVERQPTYGTVDRPALGFYIQGSSIAGMNGVYEMVDRVPKEIPYIARYAYRKWRWGNTDDLTGWHMMLVSAPGDGASYELVDRTKATEWLLLDPQHRTRFGHAGDTVIPAAGTKWQHLFRHGATRVPGVADDTDELPWQVVFLHTREKVQEFRQREAEYHENIARALAGRGLPPTSPCQGMVADDGSCLVEEDPNRGRMGWDSSTGQPAGPLIRSELPPTLEANEAFSNGKYKRSAELFAAARAAGCESCTSPLSSAWHDTVTHSREAEAHRLAGDNGQALRSARLALKNFPRYRPALIQRGLALLGAGRPATAVRMWEQLLALERHNTNGTAHIFARLVQAHALKDHAREAQGALLDQAAETQAAAVKHGGNVASFHGASEPDGDQSVERAKAARLLEAEVLAIGYTKELELPPVANHYHTLGLPVDFETAVAADTAAAAAGQQGGGALLLKRAYKERSRASHPDREGGSEAAFQAVAKAYEVLGDAAQRSSFDRGEHLSPQMRGRNADGSEAPALQEQLERLYYPERFGFYLFGDPHRRKWQHDAEHRLKREREAELKKQLAGSQGQLQAEAAEIAAAENQAAQERELC